MSSNARLSMLILLADENFNHDIVRGLRRRLPQAEIRIVQEEGLAGWDISYIIGLNKLKHFVFGWQADVRRLVNLKDFKIGQSVSDCCHRRYGGALGDQQN